MPNRRELELGREKTLHQIQESQERIEELLKDLLDVVGGMIRRDKDARKSSKSTKKVK